MSDVIQPTVTIKQLKAVKVPDNVIVINESRTVTVKYTIRRSACKSECDKMMFDIFKELIKNKSESINAEDTLKLFIEKFKGDIEKRETHDGIAIQTFDKENGEIHD